MTRPGRVQRCVGAPNAQVPRPVPELKAFAQLSRAAWVAEAGRYTVQVGRSVADLPPGG